MQRAQVTAEDLTKTAYQLALEQLQNNATPTIPGGVQKAHRILKKSSSEIIADALKRQLEGLDKGLPINERLIKELALGLQKAEIEHDAAMKGQGNVFAGMTTEQLTSIMLDRALTEMIESEAMRKKILGILLQRVPTFYAEILELAKVTIVEAQST